MSEESKSAGSMAKGGAAALWTWVSRLVSRHTSSLLLFMVFCVVVAVGIFMMGDLHTATEQVQHMYAGSVQGLRGIGELQYEAQETRRATLYALTTNNSNLQVEYADQSRAADRLVTEGIAQYLVQARIPKEVEVGRRLQQDWAAYLRVRDEVLAEILEGSIKEAVDLDLTGGVPSFERVRQDLEEVKRLYDQQATEQMTVVDTSSRKSVIRLVGVLCFTLLFASASVWAIQRSKMMSAMKLAKLQMDFVASVSHELRTPLAVICASAQNIADGVVEEKGTASQVWVGDPASQPAIDGTGKPDTAVCLDPRGPQPVCHTAAAGPGNRGRGPDEYPGAGGGSGLRGRRTCCRGFAGGDRRLRRSLPVPAESGGECCEVWGQPSAHRDSRV